MNNKIKSPPSPVSTQVKQIYPWEQDSYRITCYSIYQQAVATGYTDSFEMFQSNLGMFFNQLSDLPIYEGNYLVTPLANVEQILRTAGKALEENIVIQEIPYYETSNAAGGYTVIIG